MSNVVDDFISRGIAIRAMKQASKKWGIRIGYGGDSITDGSNSENTSLYSFRAYVRKRLGYEIASNSVNGGVPGDRSDQLLNRIDSIIAQGIDVLSIMIGTNDVALPASVADYANNIIKIKEKADLAGIPIIFSTIPPKGAGASESGKIIIDNYNNWLRFYCKTNQIPLCDVFSALVDSTTGNMQTIYNSDDTHPNKEGHYKIAEVLSATIKTVIDKLPKMPWPVTTAVRGMLSNPLALTTSGWASLSSPAPVLSTSAPSAGELPAGNWLKFNQDNSGGGSAVNGERGTIIDSTKYSPGDKLLICFYIRGTTMKVQIKRNTTAVGIIIEAGVYDGTIVPFMYKYTVPSDIGTDTLRIGVVVTAGAGEIKYTELGAMNVYNLTQLGLEDMNV